MIHDLSMKAPWISYVNTSSISLTVLYFLFRALPPVPEVVPPELPFPVEEEEDRGRGRTPEMRPEDFPPGVAYLPDGDDEDDLDDEMASKATMIDFASIIETVKSVSHD